MQLLILGASGGCGRWLTRIAAERGHSVTAFVRRAPADDSLRGARIVTGDARAPDDLDAALAGQDAVLCAVGMRRASRNPWSTLLSPPDLTTAVMRGLLPAMQRAGVRRLIAISAAGVGDSASQLTWPVRRLLSLGNVGVAYRDLAQMERLVTAAPLDWLLCRPVALVDGPVSGRAREVTRFALATTIRRADVAQWMLDQLDANPPLVRRCVSIGG